MAVVQLFQWVWVCCCSLPVDGSTEAALLALQEQLHEKEMRLTDVQLEALSSAHHLQQLQDTISRMKVIVTCHHCTHFIPRFELSLSHCPSDM